MKKKLLYSLIASMSMISIGAYAAPGDDASNSALTTKGYVDTGLKYVYDSIKGDVNNVQGDITDLQDTVGNAALGTSAQTVTGAINELNTTINGDGVNSDGLVGDVEALQDAVGTAGQGEQPGTGLTGRVESLEDTVGDNNSGLVKRVNELEAASQEYIEGTGIDISQNAQGKNVVSLDLGTTQNNTTYVFKTDTNGNGTWQAMEVEDSWNPGFLTTP